MDNGNSSGHQESRHDDGDNKSDNSSDSDSDGGGQFSNFASNNRFSVIAPSKKTGEQAAAPRRAEGFYPLQNWSHMARVSPIKPGSPNGKSGTTRFKTPSASLRQSTTSISSTTSTATQSTKSDQGFWNFQNGEKNGVSATNEQWQRPTTDDQMWQTAVLKPKSSCPPSRDKGSKGGRRGGIGRPGRDDASAGDHSARSSISGGSVSVGGSGGTRSPFNVRYICQSCFKQGGAVVYQNGTYCGSRNSSHTWHQHKGFAIFDEQGKAFILRDVPIHLKQHRRLGKPTIVHMCKRMEQYHKCTFPDCSFAHNVSERECWMWVLKNDKNIADIVGCNTQPVVNHSVRAVPPPLKYQAPATATATATAAARPASGGRWSSVAQQPRSIPVGQPPRPPVNVAAMSPVVIQYRGGFSPGFPGPVPPNPSRPPVFVGAASNLNQMRRPPPPGFSAQLHPVAKQASPIKQPPPIQFTYYCYMCDKQLQDQLLFDEHVVSETHYKRWSLVEKGRSWKYRMPPRPPPFRLCDKHLLNGTCDFSKSPNNHCTSAHSMEELEEWFERLNVLTRALARKSNEEMVKLKELISNNQKMGKSILSSCVDDVDITCDANAHAAVTENGKPYKWKFTLVGERQLQRVILLEEQSAKHFRLRSPFSSTESEEIALGDVFADDTIEGIYEVIVEFLGSNTSQTFIQKVAFDFGQLPIIYRELVVHSGIDQADLVKQNSLRYLLSSSNNRWTPENAEIVWISKERSVEKMDVSNVVANLNFAINDTNYFSLLKQWLFAEEYKRQSVLDDLQFSNVEITIVPCMEDDDGQSAYPSRTDSYLAEVRYKEPLAEDMDAVTLLREYCLSAFIAPAQQSQFGASSGNSGKRMVYEAYVVNKLQWRREGVFADRLYLELSNVFTRHLRLKAGSQIKVDIQFNLATKQFRQWLRGLERLQERQLTPLIFPDLLAYYPQFASGKIFAEGRQKMAESPSLINQLKYDHNGEQWRVIEHILYCSLSGKSWVPPVVVFGPFGTGKTRTLAAAASILLTNRAFDHTRILICTHANTTADIYITLLLQRMGMDPHQLKQILWRIFHRHAMPDREDFVRFEVDQQTGRQRPERLTLTKLQQMRVVICTFSASDKLLRVWKDADDDGLSEEDKEKGAFTHIFIDEAAQALEVETVLPLCLARRSTCIVVAGDHHQIRPTVYLPQAKELSQSYLERLYYHYDNQKESVLTTAKSCPAPTILFNKNYRCHPDILSFLSSEFYGDASCLVPHAAPIGNSVLKPLYFVVSESDEEIGKNASLYNSGEADAVADQVEYLWWNWPKTWGEINIGVAVPYAEQAAVIRKKLRDRRISTNPTKVDVTRVIQMQGKEYKALVISTVRGPKQLQCSPVTDTSGRRNLGFLDDPRLINTAMTRAKYTVIVAGNPTVLCAVGSCRDIWYRYIETCAGKDTILRSKEASWHLLDQRIGLVRADVESKMRKGEAAKPTTVDDLLIKQLTRKTEREVKK